MVDGVADGLAEFAFGQDGTAEGEFVDGFLEPPVDHAACGGTHGFAQGGACLGFAQTLFDVIEVGDLTQDRGDEPWGLLDGLEIFRRCFGPRLLLLTYLDRMKPGHAFLGTTNLDLGSFTERFQTRSTKLSPNEVVATIGQPFPVTMRSSVE